MPVDITKQWYRRSLTVWMMLCLPLSWLFLLVTSLRRYLFLRGILKVNHFSMPVIVVGNLTVGGTGKTPFVIWLTQLLISRGYRVGIVSRGVGGKAHLVPHVVTDNDLANEVGDEALLLRHKTKCPMVICIDRSAAVKKLLQLTPCDVVISDDGLQHYRLGRALEIVMIDAKRHFGNQQLLPAGPLREPISRLATVDFIVSNIGTELAATKLPFIKDSKAIRTTMSLQFTTLQSVQNLNDRISLAALTSKTVHAIAAIGHPEQFFATLEAVGLIVIRHVFADHYLYTAQDITFADDLPVIMTEKDAMKCRAFASALHWYLPVTAQLSPDFQNMLLSRLSKESQHAKMENDTAINIFHAAGDGVCRHDGGK